MLLVTACVMAIAMVVLLSPWQETVTSQQSPFVQVFESLGLAFAGEAMNAVLVIAAFSAGLGLMYATTRTSTVLALGALWSMLVALWWIPGLQIAIKAGLPYLVMLLVAGAVTTAHPQSHSHVQHA